MAFYDVARNMWAALGAGPRGNTQKRMQRETNTRIAIRGRGLHSSTFQLDLSPFWHKIHPEHPRIPPATC